MVKRKISSPSRVVFKRQRTALGDLTNIDRNQEDTDNHNTNNIKNPSILDRYFNISTGPVIKKIYQLINSSKYSSKVIEEDENSTDSGIFGSIETTKLDSDSDSNSSFNSSLTFSSSRRRLDFEFSPTTATTTKSKPRRRELTKSTTNTTIRTSRWQLNSFSSSSSISSIEDRHELIMQSLEIEHISDSRLIGDKSRDVSLSTVHSNKHVDLNCISAHTLKSLINGDNRRYVIIDSRYPYEFEAGHIRGAMNLYTKEAVVEWALANRCDEEESETTLPLIVIFHCEFSSERGPSLLRFLRSQDRAMNSDRYPRLFYPELYLLDGGYKNFFELHPDYCEPRAYKPMLHEDHSNDLKHFRAKTKTWQSTTRSTIFKQQTTTRFSLQRYKSTLF